jgi:hypothetical protein
MSNLRTFISESQQQNLQTIYKIWDAYQSIKFDNPDTNIGRLISEFMSKFSEMGIQYYSFSNNLQRFIDKQMQDKNALGFKSKTHIYNCPDYDLHIFERK